MRAKITSPWRLYSLVPQLKSGLFRLASANLLEDFFSTILHAIDELACLRVHRGHQPPVFIHIAHKLLQKEQTQSKKATATTDCTCNVSEHGV